MGPLGARRQRGDAWGPSGPIAPPSQWCMTIDLAILDLGKGGGGTTSKFASNQSTVLGNEHWRNNHGWQHSLIIMQNIR